ncbi:MAG: PadR family transcriptional regulator [Cellulomonadaceae bacterium]|nr:PadR family transcriptional regulator [Cellulomonadaceae bacterium]
MKNRSAVLETAILGQLSSTPLHGYEIRKLLALQLGPFRAFSYGTLYPALRSLAERGLISSTAPTKGPQAPLTRPGRNKIIYQLTEQGNELLHTVLSSAGPAAWEDDTFDVRFALFGQTDADTRLRILEGRRIRLTERLATLKESAARAREQLDEYSVELQRHGLDTVDREVRWLDGLITTERARAEHASPNP